MADTEQRFLRVITSTPLRFPSVVSGHDEAFLGYSRASTVYNAHAHAKDLL